MRTSFLAIRSIVIVLLIAGALNLHAQGTAFTYQGRLTDNGSPANGSYDLRFLLYETNNLGAILAGPLTNAATGVTNGLFTVVLDFGAGLFTGAERWLELGVRTNGVGNFVRLTPRQPLTPSPYAIYAAGAGTAATATNAGNVAWTGLTGVPAGFADNVDDDTTYTAGVGLLQFGTTFRLDIGFTDGIYWRLAPLLSLGTAGTAGRLELHDAPSGLLSVLLDGDNGFMQAIRSDGDESARVGGPSFGELRLWDADSAVTPNVLLTAGSTTGASLTLRNENESVRVELDANGALGGGELELRDTNAVKRLELFGNAPNVSNPGLGTSGGGADFFAADSTRTIALRGQLGRMDTLGSVNLLDAIGGNTLASLSKFIDAAGVLSGRLRLSRTNGIFAEIGADNITDGVFLELRQATGVAVKIAADSTTSFGPEIKIYQNDGEVGVRLTGETGVGDSEVRVNQADGDSAVILGSSGGSGQIFIGSLDGTVGTTIGPDSLSITDFGGNPGLKLTSAGITFRLGIGRNPAANNLEVEGTASKTTAGDWLANSDARIKTDVQTVTGALDKLAQVRPVQFHYTDDYRAAHPSIANQSYLNIIAQEFREVFPEHVKAGGDTLPDGSEILQADTYPLTIYSVAAIQELNQKLTKELNRRDTENAELKARLEKLEQLMNKENGGVK